MLAQLPVLLLAIIFGIQPVNRWISPVFAGWTDKSTPTHKRGASMSDQVLAFAGAEGYGAGTTGGRGGAVIHVTNLNDSGAGSLRWALEQQSGARTIVFDVGGTISLKSQILVQNGDVTIAGQTAAGEGITIEGARVRIKADNVIIRGIHFRPGDDKVGQAAGDRDGLMIGTTDFTIDNVIVDHNSFSWAIDENVDINGYVRNITVSNNIIAEGLSNSIHPKGEHSKGMLVSNWEGTKGDEDSRITITSNLFSDNMARNPEVRAGQDVEIVNNFVYDYGLGYSAIAVGGGSGGTLLTSVKVVGNVMTPALSTTSATKTPISFEKMGAGSTVELFDNLDTVLAADALGNQAQSKLFAGLKGAAITAAVSAPASAVELGSGATVRDSSQVAAYVLANAGAVNGAGRDSVDTRIINEAANGTGKIINAVADVNGKDTAYAVGVADTDRDGMVDWFEDLYGFNKLVADNNGDNDRDGFTNVEEYINGLISGFDLGKANIGRTVAGWGGIALTGQADGATEVTGFVTGRGKIDVSGVLAGYTNQSLSRVVEIGYASGDSYISVGTGAVKTLVAKVDGTLVKLSDITAGGSTTTTGTTDTGTTTTPPVSPPPTTPVVVAAPVYRYLSGTANNDNISVKADNERVVEGANGGTADQVTSWVHHYTLDANIENLAVYGTLAFNGTGNELANKISGNANANILDGAAGDDKISGAGGDDTILGGLGADWVQGDAGDDALWGGKGADTLVGGVGCDSFCFAAGDSIATATTVEDKITDFGAGDVIFIGDHLVDMTIVAATTIKTAKYADAFTAASKLVGASNDVALVHSAKDAWLFWDTNHDGKIDSGVLLQGAEARLAEWMVAPGSEVPLI